ncbi:MAG: ribonuclease P protein component 4 [Halobacteria archaeon]
MTDVNRIARERIELLFGFAESVYGDSPKHAHLAVERAREVGMRCRVEIPARYKRRVCSNCYRYLVYGDNARSRLREGHVAVTCLECNNIDRYPYSE